MEMADCSKPMEMADCSKPPPKVYPNPDITGLGVSGRSFLSGLYTKSLINV